jgi:hypothetical protein
LAIGDWRLQRAPSGRSLAYSLTPITTRYR